MTTLLFPWPPSTNHLHRSTPRGVRYSTPQYRAWCNEAMAAANKQLGQLTEDPKCIEDNCYLFITAHPPTRRAYDIDNRLKAPIDMLSELRIIDNDKLVKGIHVIEDKDASSPGTIMVTVAEDIGDWLQLIIDHHAAGDGT